MKSGREHRVPLSPRAVEISETGAGACDGSAVDLPRPKAGQAALEHDVPESCAAAHDDDDHDARLPEFVPRLGRREDQRRRATVCEAALAHTLKDKTEAAYNRTDLFDKRRELMDPWAQFRDGDAGHGDGNSRLMCRRSGNSS